MKILWNIHLYPPTHNCGSEYVAHNVNKYLISKGHHCRVILQQDKMHDIKTPYNYEGVEVFRSIWNIYACRLAYCICTYLYLTQFTILIAHEAKKPLIHFVHNDIEYSSIMAGFGNQSVVYNSEWTKKRIGYPLLSMVLHPPCEYDYYNVNDNPVDNQYITLINLDQNKCGRILQKVAGALPNKKFLGVIGGYSSPAEAGQIKDQPSNVTVTGNTHDILSVYSKTRILLMPSAYESWGRTATEAMCSGIPVICTPTPGLMENCGEAGLFVPARSKAESLRPIENSDYDFRPIIDYTNKLDNNKYYKQVSDKCRARAQELRPEKELDELENFMYARCNNVMHP